MIVTTSALVGTAGECCNPLNWGGGVDFKRELACPGVPSRDGMGMRKLLAMLWSQVEKISLGEPDTHRALNLIS